MFQSCSRFKMAELGAAPAGMFEARLEHCGVLRRVVEGVRGTHSIFLVGETFIFFTL